MRIDTYPATNADIAERVNELQTLVDILPVGIAIAHDAACDHVTGNAHFLQMFGLAPGINVSLSAPTGKRLTGLLAVRDGAEMSPDELPLQVAAREGREVRDQVIQLLRSDGVTVVLLGSAVPLFDAAGRAQGAIGAFFDIDDRLPSPAERERLRAELGARVEAPVAELAGANRPCSRKQLPRQNRQCAATAGGDQADWLDLTHDAILVHDLDGQILSLEPRGRGTLWLDARGSLRPKRARSPAHAVSRSTQRNPEPIAKPRALGRRAGSDPPGRHAPDGGQPLGAAAG